MRKWSGLTLLWRRVGRGINGLVGSYVQWVATHSPQHCFAVVEWFLTSQLTFETIETHRLRISGAVGAPDNPPTASGVFLVCDVSGGGGGGEGGATPTWEKARLLFFFFFL